MSEENVTEENNSEAKEDAPKKNSKLFLIIGIVAVLAMGGGGFYFGSTFSSSGSDEKEGSEKAEKEKPGKEISLEDDEEKPKEEEEDDGGAKKSLKVSLPDDEDVKHVIELPPFVVNLNDQDQARYLRLTVNLGIGGENGGEEEEEPDKLFLTRVKNAMLSVLSVKTSEDVLTIEGKTKLRKQLLKAAQAASEEPHVEAIYITDFLVQL